MYFNPSAKTNDYLDLILFDNAENISYERHVKILVTELEMNSMKSSYGIQ